MADPGAERGSERPSAFGDCLFCGLPCSSACCTEGHYACDLCLAPYNLAFAKAGIRDPKIETPGDGPGKLCPADGCWQISPAREPELKGPNLAQLPSSDPKHEEVVRKIRDSLPNAQIDKIYTVRNRGLWEAWKMCREALRKRGRAGDEQMLYHATWRSSAGSIARSGFDIRLSGASHGQALGTGIYVATRASFAHSYSVADRNGALCMIVARALLGATGTGRGATSSRRGGFAEIQTDTFHSGEQYAVRREQQLYPMYIVYYTA